MARLHIIDIPAHNGQILAVMANSHYPDMMISAHSVLAPYPACMYQCKFHVHAHDQPCVHHYWVRRRGFDAFVCIDCTSQEV